jgi:hypothetical protein
MDTRTTYDVSDYSANMAGRCPLFFCSVRSLLANIAMSLNSLQWPRLRGHFHLTSIKFCYRVAEELLRMFGV